MDDHSDQTHPNPSGDVSISLWLPVGRPNFYSMTANSWLLLPDKPQGVVKARSRMLDGSQDYVPRLQVSVLRRLLEVLPLSFGYEHEADCTMNDEIEDLQRPVAVTLTLRPKSVEALPAGPERRANEKLAEQRVGKLTLRVNEHGFYTFTAHRGGKTGNGVAAALLAHVLEVFGGDYSLNRGDAQSTTGDNGGGAALLRYNGLLDPTTPHLPRGILTFFQLNVLVEGLFNESLSPAVFFEQYDWLGKYREQTRRDLPGALMMIEQMSEAIGLLIVKDVDAREPEGQVVALRRFLDVTSREVLQRLKWSIESARRSLLDESVTMLHRQTKLVQLDMGALSGERTPELAEGASESQLRGYVMLIAAKLPLVRNVHEFATLATHHLENVALGRASTTLTGQPKAVGPDSPLAISVRRLAIQLDHWQSLVRGLRNNVRGLEDAIKHAWRENLLYEQQQVRREQEAVAEIQRSRGGRPSAGSGGTGGYNFLMFVLAAVAALVAVRADNFLDRNTDWATTLLALAALAVVAALISLVVPLVDQFWRVVRDRVGANDSYPYEFTFQLHEAADATLVRKFLKCKRRYRLRQTALRKLTLINRGGGRIERVSDDRALVKIHSSAIFKVAAFARYARFEVVVEVLAHRVSTVPTYAIVQCRLFGGSPRPLQPASIYEFVAVVLHEFGVKLTTSDQVRKDKKGIEVEKVLELVGPLFADDTERGRVHTTVYPVAGHCSGISLPVIARVQPRTAQESTAD
jgi:hypothetical protein